MAKIVTTARTSEQRGKRIQIERALLQTLVLTGIAAVAVVAPNAIGALKKLDPHWQSKIDPNRRVSQALYRLRRKGFVARSDGMFRLTSKGNAVLASLEERQVSPRRPLRWGWSMENRHF